MRIAIGLSHGAVRPGCDLSAATGRRTFRFSDATVGVGCAWVCARL